MRVVVQRVAHAQVNIQQTTCAQIGKGLLLLVGITHSDSEADLDWMCQKITKLRIFSDENGQMNLSVLDIKVAILVVSQFTLYADVKKGNRPSFVAAAAPSQAAPFIELFRSKLSEILQQPIPSGVFGADMQVSLINDGPVTILLDSKI